MLPSGAQRSCGAKIIGCYYYNRRGWKRKGNLQKLEKKLWYNVIQERIDKLEGKCYF